ncbi:MAG: cytochrome c biogenesis protein CcsA [Chloroflexi bacterium]|nr:cytochrome c biogenesis protein CcsA [Chloroflexota bacterium]
MAGLANRASLHSFQGYLAVVCGVLMAAAIYLIFIKAPTDLVLGDVQRIFYFHVPIAITSFVAFFLVFFASIAYLVRRDLKWDRLAHASAEVGVVFVTLALLTGVIWGRPVWNTWWTWEPRLTTTLILWLIYVGYLMVRANAPSQAKAALYAAVVGIVDVVGVPITYFSVYWWRSIHPAPVIGPLAQPDALEPVMLAILLFSQATFFVLFAYLVVTRVALRRSEDELRGIRFQFRRIGQRVAPAQRG